MTANAPSEGKTKRMKNLDKRVKFSSSDDSAMRNGQKGGRKCAENKRQRKTFAEALEILLRMPIKEGEVIPLEDVTTVEQGKKANLTVNDAIMLKLICKARAGDIKAIELLREQIGEAKPQQVETTVRIVDEAKLKSFKKRIDKDPELLTALSGHDGEKKA